MTDLLTPMTEQRHRDVRALLVTEATPRPEPVRPRAPRVVLVMGAASVATAAVAVVAVTALRDVPQGAALGWSPVPQAAAAGGTGPANPGFEQWSSQCNDLVRGGFAADWIPPDPQRAASRAVLVDVRGDFTFCVDVDYGSASDQTPWVALAGVDGPADLAADLSRQTDGSGWAGQGSNNSMGEGVLPRPAADDVLLFGDETSQLAPGFATAFGPAGADVTGVEIVLTDGTRITATVMNGLFGAWWPSWESTAVPAELFVTTASGTRAVDPSDVRYRDPSQA